MVTGKMDLGQSLILTLSQSTKMTVALNRLLRAGQQVRYCLPRARGSSDPPNILYGYFDGRNIVCGKETFKTASEFTVAMLHRYRPDRQRHNSNGLHDMEALVDHTRWVPLTTLR